MRFVILLIAAFAALPGAAMAGPFDGNWSVMVTSEYGECDRRFNVPIAVRSGHVAYRGRFRSEAHGRVGSNGRVKLVFRHSDQVVNATGTLHSPTFGNGGWKSKTLQCSGTWIARRR